ncbi:MAG: DUF6293 family protein [Methanomassiliicoccaceae archaeon]|nr:DUF6293 family protein [Methanomassiliicoccaceae archaeon]
MASGRKDRVVVSCVTFETAKVSEPVAYYAADRAHLIHYTDPSDERNLIYEEFYREVCSQIRAGLPKAEIVEHEAVVFDFTAMLRTVLNILRSERDADVFVNTSAGTSEYTAAAVIASMMTPGTVPFTVGTKDYSIPDGDLRSIYFRDGSPVGLALTTREPKALPYYRIDVPEEHLVAGLRVFDGLSMGDSVGGAAVIGALKASGIWYRKERKGGGDGGKRYEAVCYQRDFVDRWKANGWIEKDGRTKKHRVTDAGRTVLDTFYTQ